MKQLVRSPWKKHHRVTKEYAMEEVRQLSYPHAFDHDDVCAYCEQAKSSIKDVSYCAARAQFEALR